MTKIIFIYQDRDLWSQKEVAAELRLEGYDVNPIHLESIDFSNLTDFDADLVIVPLHPDVPATWGAYLDLRHSLPEHPVLAYMRHHKVNGLKAAIENIFDQRRKKAQMSGKSR
ncbi:MAG: hypothetical protein K9J79_03340 [Desulfobacteraceae bacterium]|nr:hypothetical protein [Desulfobacteraceae bacterium]